MSEVNLYDRFKYEYYLELQSNYMVNCQKY